MVALNRDWSASYKTGSFLVVVVLTFFFFSIEFNQAMMAMAEFGIL